MAIAPRLISLQSELFDFGLWLSLFLDTDDLIAMQEGRDVLAKAFSNSSAG